MLLRFDDLVGVLLLLPSSSPVLAVPLPKIGNVMLFLAGVEFFEEGSDPPPILDEDRLVSLALFGEVAFAGVAVFLGMRASEAASLTGVAFIFEGVLFFLGESVLDGVFFGVAAAALEGVAILTGDLVFDGVAISLTGDEAILTGDSEPFLGLLRSASFSGELPAQLESSS